ncbi:hypothetical protein [Campylobacter ureolyticus]|uniref:hypothetical protein n=1 Tax=Campylobacter ureolyticus TaxID=827 RepID=UPI0022B438AF|nr:hypothetical protein [Campylobacter ureolyticus]MCZ6162898.1 hypothetical protein [Campylobacter ureolyticus]MCZ6164609.1 hypothetical protein [Campylobacter ureolyticus]
MRKYIYLGVALILALVGWRLNVLESRNDALRLENKSLVDNLAITSQNLDYLNAEFTKTLEILNEYESNKTLSLKEVESKKDEIYKKKDDNKTINPIIYDSVQFISNRLWNKTTTN